MICTQFDAKVKILRTGNGTEYMNKMFGDYLDSNGIIHQTSCPYTSAQNGVAERKNRHLLEVARSLMFTMNLPKTYWGDAILVAAYLINRMPLKTLNFLSPLEALKGKNEYIVPPKVFGCVCFVHSRKSEKLDPRALKCVFIGYSPTQKGYKCSHPPSRKVFVSMDVTFRESEPYFSSTQSPLQGETNKEEEMILPSSVSIQPLEVDTADRVQGETVEGDTIDRETVERVHGLLDVPGLKTYSRKKKAAEEAEEVIMQSAESNLPVELPTFPNELDLPVAHRKGVRTCTTQHPLSNFVSFDSLSPSYRAFVLSISSVSILQDWREAFADSKWKQAMTEEMKALSKNNTWELVTKPRAKKLVDGFLL